MAELQAAVELVEPSLVLAVAFVASVVAQAPAGQVQAVAVAAEVELLG